MATTYLKLFIPMTMKTLSARIASAFTIFALTVGVMTPLFALPQDAFAAGSYTIVGSASVSGTTITLSGTATANPYTGQSSDQVVAVDWTGACSNATKQTFPFSSITFVGGNGGPDGHNNGTFTNATWATSTNMGASGSYNVCVKVYHGNFNGAEGSDAATFSATVVIPSTKGGLLVQKVLVNDNGGTAATTSFSFSIPGVNAGNPIAFEADAQNDFTLTAGAYNVTEVMAPGYATTYSGCNATVTAGATTTCTITNNDIAPTLTVIKQVMNDNGGLKGVSDFPLFINGNPTTSGTPVTLSAGTYTVTETGDPGYAATFSGHCASNGTVTLALGENKTCTITNNDIGPKLTVTKVLNYTHGGTKLLQDFVLLVNGLHVVSGVENTYSAGTKTVSEVLTPGYTGVISGNCAADGTVVLGLGDVKNCTITNSDVAPSLTLIKLVVGGPNSAAEWTLSATGPTSLSGTTPVTSDASFTAGTYSLSETAGGLVSPYYVAGPWVCTGTGTQDGASIALDVGETATCTITNTYTPPICDDGVDNDGDGFTDGADVGCESPTDTSEANESTLALCTDGNDNDGDGQIDLADSDCAAYIPKLTVNKVVMNDSNLLGATSNSPIQFSFQVNGGTAQAFDEDGSVTVSMPVGSYTVTEPAVQGYVPAYSAGCTGSLIIGGTATCTITNDDQPTTITIVKNLPNNSGKTAVPEDFSFTLSDSDPYFFDEDGSVTITVMPGTQYDVVETEAPGFETTYTGACENVTPLLGQSLQCSITNDDLPACSDGLDNDGDGFMDYPADLGCEGLDDQSESNETTLPLCIDEVDNDGDGLVDLADPDCAAFLPTITVKKVIVNDNGGTGTFSSFFFQVNGGEQTNFDAESGETIVTVPAGEYSITEVAASGYTTTYEGCSEIELGANGSATCTITNNDVAPVVEPQNGQCNDGIDNEGDTLIDQQDPQCFTNGVYNPTNTEASPTPTGGGGGITGLGGGGGAVLGASTVGQVLGVSCGVYMDKYVRQGKRNNPEQVTKLQQFLNKYMGTALPLTGFYGPLTAAAVNAFQSKHADTILAPWGISTPTGIVYRTTLRQINVIECSEIAAGIPELVEWSKANDPAKPE